MSELIIEPIEKYGLNISAESKNAAASLLIEKALYPIKIEEEAEAAPIWKKNVFGTGVSAKDRVLFTRQLSTLVKAGLPITQHHWQWCSESN